MKILQASFIRGVSGSERFLLNIIPQLIKRNHELGMLILYIDKGETRTFIDELEKTKCKIHLVDISLPQIFFSIKKIGNIMKEYEITNSHLLYPDFILSISKFFFATKAILVSGKHGYEEYYTQNFGFNPKHKKRNLYWVIATLAEKNINRSFTISKGLFNLFTGLGITKKVNTKLIYYGFQLDEINQVDNRLRLSENQLCIVGRLSKYKGHTFAINAVKVLKDKFSDLKLILIGGGANERELKEEVKQLQLEENVKFLGFKSNAREYMNNSDIVLIPSISEGFGIVVAEAMSVKKPIIGFDVPAINEIIEDGKSGILIDPYNIQDLADKIEELLLDKEVANTLGEAANHRLKTEFSMDKMVDNLESFYKQ